MYYSRFHHTNPDVEGRMKPPGTPPPGYERGCDRSQLFEPCSPKIGGKPFHQNQRSRGKPDGIIKATTYTTIFIGFLDAAFSRAVC